MKNKMINLILGMKITTLRENLGLSETELAKRAGISVSYLNEIERGKKSPKSDKLNVIATALNISIEELVQPVLSPELDYYQALVQSPNFRRFPFHLFGLEPADVLGLIPHAPHEGRALVKALKEISTSHDLQMGEFFHVALRCYQMMHQNYLTDIEQKVDRFRQKKHWSINQEVSLSLLSTVLKEKHGCVVDEKKLENEPALDGFRSILKHKKQVNKKDAASHDVLYINPRLFQYDKMFQVAREIGFRELGLTIRGYSSPDISVESYEQVVAAYKASYFASALCMNRYRMRDDLKNIFAEDRCDSEVFERLINRYNVSPEMFFYRMSEIMPQFFGIQSLFFMTYKKKAGDDVFSLDKQLVMPPFQSTRGARRNEQLCRALPPLLLMKLLEVHPERQLVLGLTRATFFSDRHDPAVESSDSSVHQVLCFSSAQRTRQVGDEYEGAIIGFLIDESLLRVVRFLAKIDLPEIVIGETCQRCVANDCSLRSTPPIIIERRKGRREQRLALEAL